MDSHAAPGRSRLQRQRDKSAAIMTGFTLTYCLLVQFKKCVVLAHQQLSTQHLQQSGEHVAVPQVVVEVRYTAGHPGQMGVNPFSKSLLLHCISFICSKRQNNENVSFDILLHNLDRVFMPYSTLQITEGQSDQTVDGKSIAPTATADAQLVFTWI